MDRRLGLRLQRSRVRAIAGHGVVSTGAQTPGLLGFQNPETTPPSIPTTPRTAPAGDRRFESVFLQQRATLALYDRAIASSSNGNACMTCFRELGNIA